VLITQGLAAGDRVIVAGLQKIKPGIAVKAVEQPAGRPDQSAPGPHRLPQKRSKPWPGFL
jgi:membrane fusion protein, multidrug efflux system